MTWMPVDLVPFGTVSVRGVGRFSATETFGVVDSFSWTPKPVAEPRTVMERILGRFRAASEETPVAVLPVVSIRSLSWEFREYLLDKVEENVSAGELSMHWLGKAARAELLCKALGERAETSLAHVWELLTRQPGGRDEARLPPHSLINDATRSVFVMDFLDRERKLGCTDEDINARLPDLLKQQAIGKDVEYLSTCLGRGNLFFVRGTHGVLFAVYALYAASKHWGATVETHSGWQIYAEVAEDKKYKTAYPRGATLFSR